MHNRALALSLVQIVDEAWEKSFKESRYKKN